MLINEVIANLQNLIKRKITYEEIAPVFDFKSGNAIRNWVYRNKDLKDYEVEKIYNYFGVKMPSVITFDLTENNKPKIICDYFYDVFGSCGSGAFVLSEQKKPIDVPVEAIKNFSKSAQYSVINAVGDSMLPYIHNKDLLIVEHTTEIKDGQIYVFCYNDTIYVKRLVKNINELVIISDNPDKTIYKTITLSQKDTQDVIVIGHIVGLMRQCS